MTDSKKVLGQKQKQKQRQTQRQTVVVNIGETARKRKRAPRKPKSQPPEAPRIIQQFVPQYAPLPDYGQIQRLVQSEIRMLEPPRTMRLGEQEFQESRLEFLRGLALRNQKYEQEEMERGSIEEDVELMKKQAQADQAPIASTSGLQPFSTDRQPLINQSLNAPLRLADESPSPVLSLDNRPMEIEAAERIVKGNKMKRSQSVPPSKNEDMFAVMELEQPIVLPKGKGKAKIVVKNEEETPAATAASSSRGRPMTKKQQKAQEKRQKIFEQLMTNS